MEAGQLGTRPRPARGTIIFLPRAQDKITTIRYQGVKGRTKDFDVVDLTAVLSRNSITLEGISYLPRESRELVNVCDLYSGALLFDQKKPVPSPGYLTGYLTPPRDIDHYFISMPKTRNILYRHPPILTEGHLHDPDRRFNPVTSLTYAPEMGKSDRYSHRSMNTTMQKPNIVEKNYSCDTSRFAWLAK